MSKAEIASKKMNELIASQSVAQLERMLKTLARDTSMEAVLIRSRIYDRLVAVLGDDKADEIIFSIK